MTFFMSNPQPSSAPLDRGNPSQSGRANAAALYHHDPIVQHLPASDLADHPMLAHIPVWRRDDQEFISLVESIRERGLDYPVLIDRERRVVDGRNRRNGCAVLGALVPCVYVEPGAAAGIIVDSLVNRRHLTKGALAYLSAPLFADVLEETKARRFANLSKSRVPSETPLSGDSRFQSAEDVAAMLGIGHSLFEQALKLRRMFDELPSEVRERYEPRVLGPWQDDAGEWQDPVGLGYMINGITSLITEKSGRVKKLGKRAEHARLFVGALPKLRLHWDKATPEQRVEIADRLKSEVSKWPADLREELATAVRTAERANRE